MNAELITAIRALREYRDKLAAAACRANDEVAAIDADLAALEFDNVAGKANHLTQGTD
jgi:hypothetical protein